MARTVVVPRGSWTTGALATAMIVAGIGMAVDGLLLAGAGVMLSLIDWERFKAANPWAFPNPREDPDAAAAAMTPEVASASLRGTLAMGVWAGLALLVVQLTGERLAALGPAALATVTGVLFTRRVIAALERR